MILITTSFFAQFWMPDAFFCDGSYDPEDALQRLRTVLNRNELVHTLDRMNRQPVARLSGMET